MLFAAALFSVSARAFATNQAPRGALGLAKSTLTPNVSAAARSNKVSLFSTMAPADSIKSDIEGNKGKWSKAWTGRSRSISVFICFLIFSLFFFALPSCVTKLSITVVIYSKSYCPFCTKTKDLFKGMGVEAKIYELDNMDDGADIQAALGEMTGQRTVPSVFIAGKHLGGNSEVQTANGSGALKELLGM
jgi:glutaredoxin 3